MTNNEYLIYSIEDDSDIADILTLALKGQGFSVKNFETGEAFLDASKEKKPNMILLDMMLPGIQGRDILKLIRKDESNKNIVIIIVSAKSLVSDKIDGLNLGADDYIAKPFDINEFISRIRAHYRRHVQSSSYSGLGNVLNIRNYQIDFDNHTLWKDHNLIPLTLSEYKIVALLFENHGKLVTKNEISEMLYGLNDNEDRQKRQYRTIDMLIKDIRQKIGDTEKTFIQTVFGSGYLLNE